MKKLIPLLFLSLVAADQQRPSTKIKDVQEEFWRRDAEAAANFFREEPDAERERSLLKENLELALGKGCDELKYPVKIEIPSRGLIIVAKECLFNDDGAIELRPCTIVQFRNAGKGIDPTKTRMIREESVLIRLEQPVKSITDICKHPFRTIYTNKGIVIRLD